MAKIKGLYQIGIQTHKAHRHWRTSTREQERLDHSDVVWFVVDYDDKLNMVADTVIFTTLESSRQALNATEPLSKSTSSAI